MEAVKTLITPNIKQNECIQAVKGPVLVLAGPGTGKTFTIIRRIEYMLSNGIEPSSILCMTYSAAAANEMKARLSKETGAAAASVKVNTYHSFANEIITRYPDKFELLEGASLADEITKRSIMKEVLDEVKPQFYRTKWGDAYYFIPEHIKSADEIKFNRVTKEEYFNTLNTHPLWQGKMEALELEYKEREKNGKLVKTFLNSFEQHKKKLAKAAETWDIYEKYNEKLKQNNFIDFNDMINMVLDVFETDEELLKQAASPFKYFLADEYQDTNLAQNTILFSLLKGADTDNIFAVGDDDQIIYEFQGARTDTLEKFLLKFPNAEVICLNENRRSSQNILDFSYSVIAQDKTRLEFNPKFADFNISKKLSAGNEKINSLNKPAELHSFAEIRQENNFIIKTIKDLINSDNFPKNSKGEKELQQIAVLARENSRLNIFAELLEAENIPFQLRENKSIFDINSSLVIYFYLKALLNHVYYGDKLFGLLLSEPFSFDNADYAFLLEQNRLTNKDLITNIKENLNQRSWKNPGRVNGFIKVFDELSDLKGKLNLKELLLETVNRTGILEYFLNSDEKKSDNIYAVKKIIDEAEAFMYLHKGAWLKDFLDYIDTAFESGIKITIDREEYTQNAVQLLTLHSSKGREFEYVFMPDLTAKKWEGKRVNTGVSLPIDKNDKKADEETMRRSEQLRLLFVGITRAKHYLCLTYSNSIDAQPQELTSYLSEAVLNTNLVQTFNHTLEKDEYLQEIAKSVKKEAYDYSKAFESELRARTEKFVMSCSALNTYFSCPRQFLYADILKIPVLDEDRGSANYGSAVHGALQYAAKTVMDSGRYPDSRQFIEIFEKNLAQQKFENIEVRSVYLERGRKSLSNYYKYMLDTPPQRLFAAEYSFKYLPYNNHFLKGFIDRIEKNSDGTYEIFDYKTGEAKSKRQIADGMNYEHYLDQLRFYKAAFELENPDSKVTRAGIIFAEEPEGSFYTDLTEEDNGLILNKINEAYEGIDALKFNPPEKNERDCSFCSYKHICRLADINV